MRVCIAMMSTVTQRIRKPWVAVHMENGPLRVAAFIIQHPLSVDIASVAEHQSIEVGTLPALLRASSGMSLSNEC
ncbi:hypothetical protein K431DRAFT_69012 [Polychaeton citri CBS 116435]|uniref:Uncharacterized protein n=1 Tax=Polychaeton citri CBS 116435 TaxID=1314669 RepID=A0A9P4Q9B5_9PEZI|nr:hypothetical protein K431DRAFT_69012 [Polychaeton citri CBS 116435]